MRRVASCVCFGLGRGTRACAGLKEARFEPLLLIADVILQ